MRPDELTGILLLAIIASGLYDPDWFGSPPPRPDLVPGERSPVRFDWDE